MIYGGEREMNIKRCLILALVLGLAISVFLYLYHPQELKAVEYRLKGYSAHNTQHFILLHRDLPNRDVAAVASAAEKAYQAVTKDFGYHPPGRLPIIIFPDGTSLQRAFHWPAEENHQGVYYKNCIYIQAPSAWLGEEEDLENLFFLNGPMVHELTHLVVDHLTAGNCPRWFTEGVAQYEEWRVTGYTLEEDFHIDKSCRYSYEEIFTDFDGLEDVPKAYLQALEMTAQWLGEEMTDALREVFPLLRAGKSAEELFLEEVGLTLGGNDLFVTN